MNMFLSLSKTRKCDKLKGITWLTQILSLEWALSASALWVYALPSLKSYNMMDFIISPMTIVLPITFKSVINAPYFWEAIKSSLNSGPVFKFSENSLISLLTAKTKYLWSSLIVATAFALPFIRSMWTNYSFC